MKEFIYSARLDNLATVFAALESLVDYTTCSLDKKQTDDNTNIQSNTFKDSSDVSVAVFFDHEEVSSTSAQGAGSPVMADSVSRISTALNGGVTNPDFYNACIRKSFVLSIDQAHAIHPNYSSKHEAAHAPKINGGVVVKTNSNQRYATNGITGFIVRELGHIIDIPVQEFVVRNDCGCGSTIGPAISAKTGIRVVDVGSRFTIFFIWLHWLSSCIKKNHLTFVFLSSIVSLDLLTIYSASIVDALMPRGNRYCRPFLRRGFVYCLLQSFPFYR